MRKRKGFGQACVSLPQAIPTKGLVPGSHHAEASLPTTWLWTPCPVSGRIGPALCPPAAATGQCRGSPSKSSEASGSSSALSGQTVAAAPGTHRVCAAPHWHLSLAAAHPRSAGGWPRWQLWEDGGQQAPGSGVSEGEAPKAPHYSPKEVSENLSGHTHLSGPW